MSRLWSYPHSFPFSAPPMRAFWPRPSPSLPGLSQLPNSSRFCLAPIVYSQHSSEWSFQNVRQMASLLCSQPSNTFTADSDSNPKPFSLPPRSYTIWTFFPHSHHSSQAFLSSVTQRGQIPSVLQLLTPSSSTFTRPALTNFSSRLKSYLIFKAFSNHPLKNTSATTFRYPVLSILLLLFCSKAFFSTVFLPPDILYILFIACFSSVSSQGHNLFHSLGLAVQPVYCTSLGSSASSTTQVLGIYWLNEHMIRQSFMQLKTMANFHIKSINLLNVKTRYSLEWFYLRILVVLALE